MSGDPLRAGTPRVVLIGDALAPVVQGIREVRAITGAAPVVVGGLAVLCRLSRPHRATVDLDIVDRRRGPTPHLEVLRSSRGASPIEPAAVLLPTEFGSVKVDVLDVRQAELDQPSDDPGDRLHAAAHAWAYDSAGDLEVTVRTRDGRMVEASAKVALPGPLIAMKLQAVMNRSAEKQGTDLGDIVRLTLDPETRADALRQLDDLSGTAAQDVALHVDLWFRRRRDQALSWITAVDGGGITGEDLELVADLLLAAVE